MEEPSGGGGARKEKEKKKRGRGRERFGRMGVREERVREG